jgi:hypothetical protein
MKNIVFSNSPNLKSIRINLPKWNYEIVKVRTPQSLVFGLTSRTQDNKHILTLDYDKIDRNVVLGDLIMLKKLIDPSLVFLFTTFEEEDELGVVGNYHLIFLNKFSFKQVQEIMSLTHADEIHRQLANKSRYREYVIRISEKGSRDAPKLLKVWNFGGKSETSFAHFLLLKRLYKFKIDVKNVKFDRFKSTNITSYNSASKLKIEDLK